MSVVGLAGFLLCSPSTALAVVIDFEAGWETFPSNFQTTYQEDGFQFVSDDLLLESDHFHFEYAAFPTYYSQNGTTALGNHHYALKVRRLDGALFSFHSFDAAEWVSMASDASAANNRSIVVMGSTAGGSTEWASFDFDFISDGLGGLPDFESFVLPSTFENLEEIEFFGISGSSYPNFYQLDNLRFDDPVHAPEPTSLLLMGTGLLGTWLRQRRIR